jgi:hypothetical protein
MVVIPYMFYEAFFPDPKQQVEWVSKAKSLPYIKSTGNSFRQILTRYVPSQVNPSPGEQQGLINSPAINRDKTLAQQVSFHISVTWNSDLSGRAI